LDQRNRHLCGFFVSLGNCLIKTVRNMNLHIINTGYFKLDGGAMFGVVPKSMWNKLYPADENNMISLAMRCLLVEDGNRLILIDNGMGDKQGNKFFGHYYLHGDDSLSKSLNRAGFTEADVTDVFLTHLHFDHCGGSVKREGDNLVPAFPNATYWSNKDHWNWATKPNAREKASFLKENILPIEESGQLKFVEPIEKSPFKEMDILYVSGHTEKMMLPLIRFKDRTICYCADLFPTASHIPLPYIMAYDMRPLLTMDEKEQFLSDAIHKNYVLFFEHDKQVECCTVHQTEKGIRMDNAFKLNDLK
jgi:glyoxylase-like metal-dependent hydrolase (beta-lactamase superfamily II)